MDKKNQRDMERQRGDRGRGVIEVRGEKERGKERVWERRGEEREGYLGEERSERERDREGEKKRIKRGIGKRRDKGAERGRGERRK